MSATRGERAFAAIWHGREHGFRTEEVALPDPGENEVLVRVRMATVCGSDLHTLRGERQTPLPAVLGHEAVGEVVAAGREARTHDGKPVVEGMRVTWTIGTSCGDCVRCRRGLPQKCAVRRKYGHEASTGAWRLNGGFASHCLLVGGTGIVEVPPTLPDSVIAPANCATATVLNAVHRSPVDPAGVVVVQGCGMLGLSALAYLRDLGIRSIVACDIDGERRQRASAFGATVSAAPEELPDVVHDLSAGDGADLVLELSGSNDAVSASFELLGVGGRLALVGSVFPVEPVGVRPDDIVRKLITVTGSHNYAVDDLVHAVDFLTQRADHDAFASLVVRCFALQDTAEAVSFAETAKVPRVGIAFEAGMP